MLKKTAKFVLYGILLLIAFEAPYFAAGWDITLADIGADAVSMLAVQAVTIAYIKGAFPFGE